MEEEIKSIEAKKHIVVSEDAYKKIMRWKLELNCRDVAEVIDRLLMITPMMKSSND